jgi:hypothetical protein
VNKLCGFSLEKFTVTEILIELIKYNIIFPTDIICLYCTHLLYALHLFFEKRITPYYEDFRLKILHKPMH